MSPNIRSLSVAERELAEMCASKDRTIAALREYAHKATCAITDLAGGGSELFAGKIDGMYKADLQFCVDRVRQRERRAHDKVVASVISERGCRAALERIVHDWDGEPEDMADALAALALARKGGV